MFADLFQCNVTPLVFHIIVARLTWTDPFGGRWRGSQNKTSSQSIGMCANVGVPALN